MDSTRISLARILEANVPLTWQDAVAVVQEVAMVNDVNAAMNSSPSLVTPETCFIAVSGEVDLPEVTAQEAPGALGDLLRAMLQGRDVPPALAALARRRYTDDLFGELKAFSSEPRRPVIAALATRALSPPPAAVPAAVLTPPALPTTPLPLPLPMPRAMAPELPATADTPRHPMPPPFVATPPAVVLAPPFRAVESAIESATSADAAASESELRRLRARTVGQEAAGRDWPARFAAWVSRRPAFPDPRLLGGTAIVIAALASLLWRDGNPGLLRSAPPAPVSTPSPATTAAPSVAAAPAAASAAPPVAPATPPPTTRAAAPNVARPVDPTPANPRRAAAVTPPPADASSDARRAAEASLPSPGAATAPPPAPVTGAAGPTSIVIPALDPPRPVTRPAGRDGGARSRTSYSAQDANVTPPVMLRQQLPSPLLEPGVEVQPGGPYLELLVDEQGAVEQVRLRARQPAPGQTWYRHRMLLAAAKAWQFEPARLDGQPVRYVMRVPLEP